jgi:sulfatase maturation enzyme AslB (radical SAM superfamily)
MCYANVINGAGRKVIPGHIIQNIADRFIRATDPPVNVYWCGTGEVFLHPDFPRLVNHLLEYGDTVRQTIQTNGTTPRRLDELTSVKELMFRVSIDGYRDFHDWHRGKGTYEKSIAFSRKAVDMGCASLEVRCMLTRGNIEHLDVFEDDLKERISPNVSLELNPVLTNTEIQQAREQSPGMTPLKIEDDSAIGLEEARSILFNRYGTRFTLVGFDAPSVETYMSLTPYGVHTCCEGMVKIGELEDDIVELKNRLVAMSESTCHKCSLFPCE